MRGLAATLTGILEIVAAVQLRKAIEGEWFLVPGGVLSVVFGRAAHHLAGKA